LIYRLGMAVIVALVLVLPVAAQENGGDTPSCDAVYAEHFGGWLGFYYEMADTPPRADPTSPCYEAQVQAQGDAFMWHPSTPEVASPPAAPTSLPTAVPSTPLPQPTQPTFVAAPPPPPPGTTPGGTTVANNTPGRLDLASLAVKVDEVPAGFTLANSDSSDNGPLRGYSLVLTPSGGAPEAGQLGIVTNAFLTPMNAGEPLPPGTFESVANNLPQGPFARLQGASGPEIGQESRWFQGPVASGGAQDSPDLQVWAVLFRSGNVLVIVTSGYSGSSGPQADTVRWAQLVAGRVSAATAAAAAAPSTAGSPAPVASAAPLAASTPTPVAIQVGGTTIYSSAPPPPPPSPTAPLLPPATLILAPPTSSVPPFRPGFYAQDYVGRPGQFSCNDFRTQAEAQAVLRINPSDPNRLDPDRDGIACDQLPGPRDLIPVPR
jgi:hypothetical protein